MLDALLFVLTLLAAVGFGVIGGLFFVFSNTVMKSLGQLPDEAGIAAMQNINRDIQNPGFGLVFGGTALASVVLIVWSLVEIQAPGSLYVLLGSVVYLVGSIMVTMFFNVPMNNALDAAPANDPESAKLWGRYLTNWTAWNHLRMAASIVAAGLLIYGMTF